MSDANAYMNAYVDNAVGIIHEYIGSILQLKTQLKICESIIAAKNAELDQLKNQLHSHSEVGTENSQLQQRCVDLQNENNALTQKVSHMDNLLKQVGEMKQDIIARNDMIANLEQKIISLEETKVTEPVVINKKKVGKSFPVKKEDDDF